VSDQDEQERRAGEGDREMYDHGMGGMKFCECDDQTIEKIHGSLL
jgi:hypothetical protein